MDERKKTNYCEIRVEEVIISDETQKLYDYSNRESEIETLVKSILEIGQQQPILVIKKGVNYVLVDGFLRLQAMIRLNLNSIDAIVIQSCLTNEFSLSDLIIHHQIHKTKSNLERLNEVKALLRIDSEDENILRDKEKRVALVSDLLGGKGWGRNNVFSLEKILRWEKMSDSNLHLAEQVLSNEISINKALATIHVINSPLFESEKEKESKVVDGFLRGNYPAQKAIKLMEVYDRKKSDSPTVIRLYPKEDKNYSIIQGNIEEIQLPASLEIDTIFTSPPYYRLVKYGEDPNELGWEKTSEEYIQRLANILIKCYDKLKPTGSMFINIAESYQAGECLAISERLTVELIKRGAIFVDRIIWKKIANKPTGNQIKRLNPGYESILHFSKTKNYYFNRFKIKKDVTLKVTKGCKEKGSEKIGYHIPNNYSQFNSVLVENDVTNVISLQIGRNRTKHVIGEEKHPATFSSNLPVIPILMSTPKSKDSIIFDPFMGSASCGKTALLLGYKFVGVELYEKNIFTSARVLNEGLDTFDRDSLESLLDTAGLIYEKDQSGQKKLTA